MFTTKACAAGIAPDSSRHSAIELARLAFIR